MFLTNTQFWGLNTCETYPPLLSAVLVHTILEEWFVTVCEDISGNMAVVHWHHWHR